MTINQKAKAYDEALNIAKETYETQPMYRAWLEKMFPQLRESKDERIRKSLIELVEQFMADERKEKTLAYLEKQKDAFENGRQLGIMQEQARQELGWPDERQKEQKTTFNIKQFGLNDFEEELFLLLRGMTYLNISDEEIALNVKNQIAPNLLELMQKEHKPAEIDFEDWDTLGYIRDIVRKHVKRDEEFNVLDKWLVKMRHWNWKNDIRLYAKRYIDRELNARKGK